MFRSLKIGTPFGIPLNIHWTFLFLIAFVVLTSLSRGLGLAGALLQLFYVFAVFTFVVLHELGHALTARRFGIGTGSITLLPIGGMATLKSDSAGPKEEFWISLAGPMVNFALVFIFWAISFFLPGLGPGIFSGSLFQDFAILNLMLGIFNLIPAFPMDGGRILRSLLSLRFPKLKATQWAVTTGKTLAVLMALSGVFLLNSPMLILVALFVWFSGGAELKALRLQMLLSQPGIYGPGLAGGHHYRAPLHSREWFAQLVRQIEEARAGRIEGENSYQGQPTYTQINPWTGHPFGSNQYPAAKGSFWNRLFRK